MAAASPPKETGAPPLSPSERLDRYVEEELRARFQPAEPRRPVLTLVNGGRNDNRGCQRRSPAGGEH